MTIGQKGIKEGDTSAVVVGRRNSGTQSIPNNINDGTVVLFPTTDDPAGAVLADIGVAYDNATGRFTNISGAPVALLVSYMVIFPASATSWRAAWVRLAGAVNNRLAIAVNMGSAETGIPLTGTCPIRLNENEFFQVCANQNSGGALSIGGTAASAAAGLTTRIQLTRMS